MIFLTESISAGGRAEAAELFPLEALEVEFLVTFKPEDAFEVTFTAILLGIFSPPKPEFPEEAGADELEDEAGALAEEAGTVDAPEEAGADELEEEAGALDDPEEGGAEAAPESIAF